MQRSAILLWKVETETVIAFKRRKPKAFECSVFCKTNVQDLVEVMNCKEMGRGHDRAEAVTMAIR